MSYIVRDSLMREVASCQESWMAEAICLNIGKAQSFTIEEQLTAPPEEGKDVILRDLVIRILERKIAINCLQSELVDADKKIWSVQWSKVIEAKKKALAGMKECQRLDEECLDKWRV